ncbi:hypothetical protein Y1Q_0011625 [Alligator mississippiensis]|uniref:Uncharacterized protein n=1 Tax=Alligator mississippiensis TaxID=8496 RepID=A0A151M0L4_ALLMI|nr:hypothetical protein Y1Q_0011625 [Alligator mississippiensis]
METLRLPECLYGWPLPWQSCLSSHLSLLNADSRTEPQGHGDLIDLHHCIQQVCRHLLKMAYSTANASTSSGSKDSSCLTCCFSCGFLIYNPSTFQQGVGFLMVKASSAKVAF